MKKCFVLLLLLPLGFGGCDDGHEPRTTKSGCIALTVTGELEPLAAIVKEIGRAHV